MKRYVAAKVCVGCGLEASLCVEKPAALSGVVAGLGRPDRFICATCTRQATAAWVQAVKAAK